MYAVSLSIDVNPPGTTPLLTREQVWAGLVMKAENAVPFVPGMTKCAVVESQGDTFLREAVYNGETLREKVTVTAPVQVLFERDGDPAAGWITNVISDYDGALILTFTFAAPFAGVDYGSPEEAARGEAMREVYLRAITNTLATVRKMAV